MNQANPYAPPKARVVETSQAPCSRDGDNVIVPVGSELPPRCIRCNAPVATPIKETKLYWHTPWLYLLILVNIVVYAVIGIIVRRTIKVSPGLCVLHAEQRRRRIFLFLGLAAGSLVCAGVAMSVDAAGFAAFFFLLAFILLIVAARVGRKVYPRRITKEYAELGGCGESFLASLE